MIKFVRHNNKNRENSLKASKNFLRKKRESNDSGTESDGELLDVENKCHLDVDMETSLSSCTDANLTTSKQTACSSSEFSAAATTTTIPPAPSSTGAAVAAAMMCHHQTTNSASSSSHLMYDQHSSEEELEVINGPAAAVGSGNGGGGVSCSSRLSNRGCTSSLDTEAPCSSSTGIHAGATGSNSKRSSSSLMVENRKRSLAHSSDDELRNSLEPISTPVNFRTSPPLEAFKPNRSHMMFRSTTPLILSEARCGIENIKLCDNSVNEETTTAAASSSLAAGAALAANGNNDNNKCNSSSNSNNDATDDNESSSVIKASSLKMSNSSHHIYQPQPKYSFHYNSSRSSPASTTGLDNMMMEVRSVSPPAKLFHCAISPRRRPSSNSTGGNSNSGAASSTTTTTTHNAAQRPHRPCLDFDKMQQVSL
ncbi:uncharacterized protein Reph isoform X1 [Drosophila tropicalis]|uniref:uncharacterized protein Reph isoform X1 n=2 Tax=Drosophila tropicalis TaxID=46794 RepID=UPI0035AB8EA0